MVSLLPIFPTPRFASICLCLLVALSVPGSARAQRAGVGASSAATKPSTERAQPTARAQQPIDLAPRIADDDLAQVTLELKAGGTLHVRQAADQESDSDAQTPKLPMSASASLRYDERRLMPSDGRHAERAVRYYDHAEAVLKVETGGRKPTLSPDRRLIVAEHPAAEDRLGKLSLSSPRGPLAREELDLVTVPSDSLAVDRLLPDRPVADGQSWSHDDGTIAALLALDSVAHCEVESVLDKHNDGFALARLAGSVVGTVDGAATEIQLRGVYLVDRRLRRITQLNLAIREDRSIGPATPGLESVAKLRLNIRPIEQSEHLTADTLAEIDERGAGSTEQGEWADSEMLELVTNQQGFRVLYDRHWFITSEERETTTLRRVVDSELVAHSTITRLPAKSAGRHTTLAEFEREIREALGGRLRRIASRRQWTNAFGQSCFEVVAHGTAAAADSPGQSEGASIPIQWHYYLVAPPADQSGHRLSIAISSEPQSADLSAARQLVQAIQLVPPTEPAPQTAARSTVRRPTD